MLAPGGRAARQRAVATVALRQPLQLHASPATAPVPAAGVTRAAPRRRGRAGRRSNGAAAINAQQPPGLQRLRQQRRGHQRPGCQRLCVRHGDPSRAAAPMRGGHVGRQGCMRKCCCRLGRAPRPLAAGAAAATVLTAVPARRDGRRRRRKAAKQCLRAAQGARAHRRRRCCGWAAPGPAGSSRRTTRSGPGRAAAETRIRYAGEPTGPGRAGVKCLAGRVASGVTGTSGRWCGAGPRG